MPARPANGAIALSEMRFRLVETRQRREVLQ
jgi:hypothetical protein